MKSLSALFIVVALFGCAKPPTAGSNQIAAAMKGKSVLLLGEVHDNAEGHAQRAALIAQAVEQGWRPAIAMEQFDRERQADLDRARASCNDADCVIRAASGAKTGWNWAFYKPVIDLALKYKLPLVAANVSRADGAKIARESYTAVFDAATLAALRLDQSPPVDIVAAQQKEIAAGHCGKLPATALPGMARAQIARDAFMAKVLRDYRQSHGIVLLAGNGHVRRDVGVPRWLGGDAAQVLSVGYVETAPITTAYDLFTLIPTATRPDPCLAFS